MQMSQLQRKLEENQRQHSALQFQIQDASLQEQSHQLYPSLQDPFSTAAYTDPPPPPYPGTERNGVPLPDFSSLSLEDANWFHEGIPRYGCVRCMCGSEEWKVRSQYPTVSL